MIVDNFCFLRLKGLFCVFSSYPQQPSFTALWLMMIGEYQHNLDSKGRLAIPAKFRNSLSKGVIITRGPLDKCLFLYSLDEWTKLADKLSDMPIAKANSLAFNRLMFAGAMDLNLDGQGRILLPDYLRKYANLGKEAIVVGLYNHLEIWDKDVWKKYRANLERTSNEIAEKLEEI